MANWNAPWNKGLTKETSDRVAMYANTLSKTKKGCISPMQGKKHTQATKELMSTVHMGQISPMKGKHHTQEARIKIGRKGGPIGSLCTICGVELISGNGMQSVSSDHDHTTGAYRGILCKRCNLMIGLVNEDSTILSKAVEYLKFWKGVNERKN